MLKDNGDQEEGHTSQGKNQGDAALGNQSKEDPARFIDDALLVAPRLHDEPQHQQQDQHPGDGGGHHLKEEHDIFLELSEKPEEPLPEVLIKELDLQNARWKQRVAELKKVSVVNLTLAVH